MIHSMNGRKRKKLEVWSELKELKGIKIGNHSKATYELLASIWRIYSNNFLISACHIPAVVKYLNPQWAD